MTRKAWVIIAIAVFFSIASFWHDSVTVDEVPHIGSGYSYLTKSDYRLNPEHPPLVKDLAAIPLLFQKIDKEALFSTRFWTQDLNGQWEFGRFLIFKASPDPLLTSKIVKFPVLIFYISAAILLFVWSKKRYGNFAGYSSILLFLFSPTVMAHARLVTTDLAAAFGVVSASYFFIKYLGKNTKKNFWLAGIFFGIALLTKFSTFLLIPYFLILALIYGFLPDKRKIYSTFCFLISTFLIFATGFILIVWPVYYFHTFNYSPEKQKSETTELLQTFGKRYLAGPVVWGSDKPVIRVAAHYGLGLLMVTQRQAGGNTTYFLGEVSKTAWKKYFPIVYFIKEPLAWWGLVLMAIITINTKFKSLKVSGASKWIKKHFVECAMLLWLLIYWTLSIRGNLNIGVRHLLPAYPFAIMLVSGQMAKLIKNSRRRQGFGGQAKFKIQNYNSKFKIIPLTIFVLLAWYLIENIRVFPHYLSYFNQMVGGPSGGRRIVVDSNLDWGQDLKRFRDWVKRNNIQKIDFDYFGWADQEWYLGDRLHWITSKTYSGLDDFKQKNATDGWIAVSTSFLMGNRGEPLSGGDYEWLRQQTPFTTVGNSIFIYKLN